jgi:hypothetical protein
MSVKIIDTLKPKNNGSFPVVEAVDVSVSESLRLPEALEAKADASDLATTNATVATKADASAVATATAELQGEIDQIVISASAESVVAPEVAAARVDNAGEQFLTLKSRLDHESNDTNKLDAFIRINYIGNEIESTSWIVGGISSSDGSEIVATNRLRSGYIRVYNTMTLSADTGYQFLIRMYDDEYNYTGSVNPTDNYTFTDSMIIRIVIKRTDDSDVALGDYKHLTYNNGKSKYDRVGNLEVGAGLETVNPTGYNQNIYCAVSPVDTSDIHDSTYPFKYYIIDCEENDVFIITNAKGGGSARLWCFVDNDYNVISNADAASEANRVTLIAPHNAVKLIVNNMGSGSVYRSEVTKKTNERFKNIPIRPIENTVFLLNTGISAAGNVYKSNEGNRVIVDRTLQDCKNKIICVSDGFEIIAHATSQSTQYAVGDTIADDVKINNWSQSVIIGSANLIAINIRKKDDTQITQDDLENISLYFLDSAVVNGINGAAGIVPPPINLIKEFEPFGTDYSTEDDAPKVLDMTSKEFIDTFYEPYLGRSNGVFCTKKKLGRDQSDTYDIWQYSFEPVNREYTTTILLSSGMHTYELPAAFGLARWIQEFMTSNDDDFEWLRNNVRIIVIPIVNPWGFNQIPTKKYGNSNGVNINRNFDDWDGTWETFPDYSPDPSDPNYNEWNVKGPYPFSEAETRILRDWLYSYQEAAFWIDCHTGLNCPYGNVWCLYSSTNPNIPKIRKGIDALKSYISDKYEIDATEYIQVDLDSFIKGYFGTNCVGIPTMVIEQQQGNNTTGYATVPNNNPIQITEYATQIHAYIIAQLQK